LEAPGISSSKAFEDTLGGGVCQVSTTLYNCALLAGCEINDRSRHSIPSSYVKTGFDAMVNWPTSDFVFTNNTSSPMYIRSEVTSDRRLCFWIYGEALEDGVTIERENEIIATEPAPPHKMVRDNEGKYADYVTYTDEAYIYVESRGGQTVQTYRVWKKNGEVIQREELFLDVFEPIEGIHYVGTKARPEGNTTRTSTDEKCYLIGSSSDPAGTAKPTASPTPRPSASPTPTP